jgi:hypothetical protein
MQYVLDNPDNPTATATIVAMTDWSQLSYNTFGIKNTSVQSNHRVTTRTHVPQNNIETVFSIC